MFFKLLALCACIISTSAHAQSITAEVELPESQAVQFDKTSVSRANFNGLVLGMSLSESQEIIRKNYGRDGEISTTEFYENLKKPGMMITVKTKSFPWTLFAEKRDRNGQVNTLDTLRLFSGSPGSGSLVYAMSRSISYGAPDVSFFPAFTSIEQELTGKFGPPSVILPPPFSRGASEEFWWVYSRGRQVKIDVDQALNINRTVEPGLQIYLGTLPKCAALAQQYDFVIRANITGHRNINKFKDVELRATHFGICAEGLRKSQQFLQAEAQKQEAILLQRMKDNTTGGPRL